MSFNLANIRAAVMESLGKGAVRKDGKEGNPYYYKLPADVSTHPSWIEWTAPLSQWPTRQGFLGEDGKKYLIKVVSSDEAKMLNLKSNHPHRMYVWDAICGKWVFVGKYCQHCKSIMHKMRTAAAESMPELLEKPKGSK